MGSASERAFAEPAESATPSVNDARDPPVGAVSSAVPAAPEPPAASAVPTASVESSAPVASEPADVVVRGVRKPLVTVLPRSEVRMLPGALGDPLRAIEALPGVTPTLSGAPYFYVRGAPPGNVGYYFDDIRLPALFHALAGPSVIHPALLDRVEFYPGPYPVTYGRSAGAVVAAFSDRGPSPAGGEFSVRATDSSLLLRTPLANDRLELTLAGRYGYANPVLRLFAPDLSVDYWDYQARLRYFIGEHDTVALLGFGAHDLLTQGHDGSKKTLYGITFHRLDLRYDHESEAERAGAGVVLGWDRSAVEDGRARIDDFSLRMRGKLERTLDRGVKLELGGDAGRVHYGVDFGALDDPVARTDLTRRYAERNDTVAGVYVGFVLELGHRVLLEPGIRADAYASHSNVALGVDPRILAEFTITRTITIVDAFALAHQAPADPLPQPAIDPPLDGGLQTAVQSSAGVRWAPGGGLTLQTTLFQSMLLNLTDGPGAARLEDAGAPSDARAIGSSRGLELLLKRSLARDWGGYLVYTLSVSRRAIGRAEGPSAFDRTHVLGAALSHDFGSGYHAGIRVTAYSGIPARVFYLEAARHPPRTPPFYRIDLRGEKRWNLARGSYLALVAEVMNATLNREVINESCNAYTCKRTYTGPVTIPNLGLEGGF
jgi:outer membrane receptor protein involved in Fe transport